MAIPNIITITTQNAKTALQAVGTSATAIVSNAANSNKTIRIHTLNIANIHASNSADITVDFFRASAATNIAKAITIPIKTSLIVISKDAPITLEEGDSLRLTASAATSLEAVCSYEEATA